MGADSRDSFTAQLLTEDTTPAYHGTAVSRVKSRDKPLATECPNSAEHLFLSWGISSERNRRILALMELPFQHMRDNNMTPLAFKAFTTMSGT